MGMKWSERSFDSKMTVILMLLSIFGVLMSIILGLFCLFNGHSLLYIMPFASIMVLSLVLREFYMEVLRNNITDKSLRQTIFRARTLKALLVCAALLVLFGVLLGLNPISF